MTATPDTASRRLRRLAACVLTAAGCTLLAFLPNSRPTSVSAGEPEKAASSSDRQINLVYTINNLGYTDTCG